jgi:tungstate transport system ATP-binding protein
MITEHPILKIKNVLRTGNGTIRLDIPSLDIVQGNILAIIGPNGAGKTTLLESIAFLLKPRSGDIFFKGEEIRSEKNILEYRRKLAMVFQEPLLFDTTVYKNVASGLQIRGMKKSVMRDRVMENLSWFGIDKLKDRSSRSLSGGEAQRTSLARAFATEPEILLLDEPFSSLDPPSRESLIEDLERILRETKTTAIFATHDRSEALRMGDAIAVMNAGSIVQLGTPEEIMNRPINELVASFVGIETVLSGRVVSIEDGTFSADVRGCNIEAIGEALIGESVLLCIRPENVTLALDSSGETTSARNKFRGRIERIHSIGFYEKIRVDCGFKVVSYVTHHSARALALDEGKEVFVSFKATAVHAIRNRRSS